MNHPFIHSRMEKKIVGLFIDKSLAVNNCRSGGSHSSEPGVDVGLKVALHVLLQTLDLGNSSSLELHNSMKVSSVLSMFNVSSMQESEQPLIALRACNNSRLVFEYFWCVKFTHFDALLQLE